MRTAALALLLLAACDEDGVLPVDTDGDSDLPVDSEPVDTELPDTDPPVDPLVRGAYLVNAVTGCATCHGPDLGGATVDFDPHPQRGEAWAPNLTPHVTGLGGWTDDDVVTALRGGRRPDGRALLPAMPSWLYGHLADADATAIVAHLRTLPAVDRTGPSPEVEPLVPTPRVPLAALPVSTLPLDDPDRGAADLGRYLATLGGCVACHTAEGAPLYPIDTARVLAGGRRLANGAVTPNLTPDATGLADRSVDDVVATLRRSVAPDGRALCAPAHAPFAGLTDDDARALAVYLLTLPAVASEVLPVCP